MKNLLIIIFFINISFSQNKITTATYELNRSKNDYSFTAKCKTYVDNLNKTSLFELNQYDNLLKNGKKIFDKKENDTVVVVGSTSICTDPKEYYFDFRERKLVQLLYNVNCKSKSLIESKLEYPKWEIKNEYKEISGYKTQKATATISDRLWTVYFTKDLKENISPWKLVGLPGVIVEATENTSTYTFKLLKIEYDYKTKKISKPAFKETSTFEQYVKKSVKQNREEMIFKLSQLEGVQANDIEPDTFPLYENIDFIEKRK